MGRLPGTVTLCILLTLSVGAAAGTLSPSEHGHNGLAPLGFMDSSRDLDNQFLIDSVVTLDTGCGFRLSCLSGSQRDADGAARPLTSFFGETAPMSDQTGSDVIHRRAGSRNEPIQDNGAFGPLPANTLDRIPSAPHGSAGPAIGGILVIELPLPPGFPLLATGVAALLIFAHRPRHR